MPVSLSMRKRLQVADQRFDQRRGRRDGVPGHHRDAGEQAPSAAAALPSMMILPAVAFMRSNGEAVGLRQVLGGEVAARRHGAPVQLGGLGLPGAELLEQRPADLLQVDAEQVGHHAVVDHVAHQLAQPGLGADRRHQLVERDRVEVQVRAQRAQLQRLVVDHRGARLELQHVFLRRLRVHGHQEIDLLLAADVAVLAGADGEPGGQAGDVGGEQVLAGDGDAHLEQGAHQNGIGGLAARAVDRRHLDGEIVDDGLLRLHGKRRGGTHFNRRHEAFL